MILVPYAISHFAFLQPIPHTVARVALLKHKFTSCSASEAPALPGPCSEHSASNFPQTYVLPGIQVTMQTMPPSKVFLTTQSKVPHPEPLTCILLLSSFIAVITVWNYLHSFPCLLVPLPTESRGLSLQFP